MNMNKYLKNLNKIEFVITNACTGQCKHCSQGEHTNREEYINPQIAADAVRKISKEYNIQTVMTFGGEPLLCFDTVEIIMNTAKALNIPKRQVITNGYFSKDKNKISEIAKRLFECGVNDLLLSVDSFHQETIPIEIVKLFANEAKKNGISIRLQPAWLVSMAHDNPYNQKTKKILAEFDDFQIPIGEGNVVFPEGNAKKYLSKYFADNPPKNPYIENPKDLRCLSFSANGDILNGNIYRSDIMKILEDYTP